MLLLHKVFHGLLKHANSEHYKVNYILKSWFSTLQLHTIKKEYSIVMMYKTFLIL